MSHGHSKQNIVFFLFSSFHFSLIKYHRNIWGQLLLLFYGGEKRKLQWNIETHCIYIICISRKITCMMWKQLYWSFDIENTYIKEVQFPAKNHLGYTINYYFAFNSIYKVGSYIIIYITIRLEGKSLTIFSVFFFYLSIQFLLLLLSFCFMQIIFLFFCLLNKYWFTYFSIANVEAFV